MNRAIFALPLLSLLTACPNDAQVASANLSTAADNFEVNRRVIFYNGITNEYMLSIEGRCSIGSGQEVRAITVTCKTGPNQYKKHYLGISNNVTFFAEQTDPIEASVYRYRVTFKPSVIIPDIRVPTGEK